MYSAHDIKTNIQLVDASVANLYFLIFCSCLFLKQSSRVEDAQSPRLSPKTSISFSINNLVAKPTVSAQPCTKVTSLVDSVESKKPYGHWIPVKSARH